MNAPLRTPIRFDVQGLIKAIAQNETSDQFKPAITPAQWELLGTYLQPFALTNGQVLIEQNASMALRVSKRAVVLEVGELALQGDAAELAASEDVQALYLGGHGGHDSMEHERVSDNRPPRRKLGLWAG